MISKENYWSGLKRRRACLHLQVKVFAPACTTRFLFARQFLPIRNPPHPSPLSSRPFPRHLDPSPVISPLPLCHLDRRERSHFIIQNPMLVCIAWSAEGRALRVRRPFHQSSAISHQPIFPCLQRDALPLPRRTLSGGGLASPSRKRVASAILV